MKGKLTPKQELWRVHITAQEKSGLSRRDYCSQHNLDLSHFSYFSAYLRKKFAPTNKADDFVRLQVPTFGAGVTIRLTSGIVIECQAATAGEVVRSLT